MIPDLLGTRDLANTGVTGAPGKNGLAASLNGVQAYLTTGTAVSGITGLTVSLWVRATDWLSHPYLVDSWSTPGTGDGFWLRHNGSNRIEAGLNLGGTVYAATSDLPVATTNWIHLVLSWETTVLTLYLNGLQQGQIPVVAAPLVSTRVMEIGRAGTGSNYFKGLVDEVYLWDRGLSGAEVFALTNEGLGDFLAASPAPHICTTRHYALTEDNFFILLEAGGKLTLEQGT